MKLNSQKIQIKHVKNIPIYTRVDAFTDNNSKFAFAELELIESKLWFRYHTKTADELAKGIHQRIHNEKIS